MTVIAIEDLGERDQVIRRHVFDRIDDLAEKHIAKMICQIHYGDNYDEEDIEGTMSSFGEDGNPPILFSDDKMAATWFDNADTFKHYTFILV